MATKKDEKFKLVARIDAALMRRFKAKVALRGTTVQAATEEAVRTWVRRKP